MAILHSDGSVDDCRLSDALAAGNVAVVCIPRWVDFEVGLQIADDAFEPSLPRMVAASGSAVPAARRAAERNGLFGAVLLNAPVGRSVGGALPATVVFVDREMLAARMWGRMASRLGNASYHVIDTSFDAPLRTWLADPGTVLRDPLARGIAVGAMVAAATVMSVSVATTAVAQRAPAAITAAVADPFDGGVSVGASRIGGDGLRGPRMPNQDPKPDEASDAAGREVPATAIVGDGTKLVAPAATGSIQLVGGNALKWFVNTNITFATTKSASGAVSEASFAAPGNATTVGGGLTASTLSDAFDGYNTLFVDVGSTTIGTSANSYRPATPSALQSSADPACNLRQVTFPVQTMQGLQVHREIYVPADGNYARWLNILTNPSGAPITVGVGTANNLGSDGNTIVTGSSNGDTTAQLTDTWVGTMQNYSGTTSSDPRLAHVIQGPGAPLAPSAVSFVNGNDRVRWAWNVTIQPGETVTLMNFAVGEVTKAAAAATAANLAALAPQVGATRCMNQATLDSVRNFSPAVTVAPVTVAEDAGSALLTFTRTASGAPATVTYSLTPGTASAGSDYTVPAVLQATFDAGATTAQASIPIIDDSEAEPAESFLATITGVTGLGHVGTPSTATITIESSDSLARFLPVDPFRAADTRVTSGGRLPAGSTHTFVLPNRPAAATAATLNVTAADPNGAGFLTVFPCDQSQPPTSNVNYPAGGATANQVTTAISAAGEVCVFSSQAADVVIDVDGWWSTGASGSTVFAASTPSRILDSRPTLQAAGSTLVLDLSTYMPVTATAVSMNVTTDQAVGAGYVTVFPCDQPRPDASNVNQSPGAPHANLTTVKLAADKTVCIFVSSSTALIVDLLGAWTPTGSGGFAPDPTPDRVYDSRSAGGVLPGGTTRQVVPTTAGTLFINLTTTNTVADGYAAAFPCDAGYTNTSTVNYTALSSASTAAIVDATHGGVCVFSSTAIDVIVDVFGTLT